MSGKSTILKKLLKHRDVLFDQKFQRVIYMYPKTDHSSLRVAFCKDLQELCPFIEFSAGLIDFTSLLSGECHILLLIDDLSHAFYNSPETLDLLLVHSHHYKISLAFTVQNATMKSQHGKSITRNCSYFIILENKADLPSISQLSFLVFGKGNSGFLESVFQWSKTNLGSVHTAILLDCNTISSNKYNCKAFIQFFPSMEDNQLRPIFFSHKKKK